MADTTFGVGICHVFNALVWMVFTRFVYLQANGGVMIRKLLIAADAFFLTTIQAEMRTEARVLSRADGITEYIMPRSRRSSAAASAS